MYSPLFRDTGKLSCSDVRVKSRAVMETELDGGPFVQETASFSTNEPANHVGRCHYREARISESQLDVERSE